MNREGEREGGVKEEHKGGTDEDRQARQRSRFGAALVRQRSRKSIPPHFLLVIKAYRVRTSTTGFWLHCPYQQLGCPPAAPILNGD